MANVIEWALKLKDQFSGPGEAIAKVLDDIENSAGPAAAAIGAVGKNLDALTAAQKKVAGAASSLRGLTAGPIGEVNVADVRKAQAGLLRAQEGLDKVQLKTQQDALAAAEKAQADHFKKLRAAARAAAAPTDIEKGLNSFLLPKALVQAPKQLGVVQKVIQQIGKVFGPSTIGNVVEFADSLGKVGDVAAVVAGPVLDVGAAVGAISIGVVAAATAVTAKFTGAVIEAQAFRQSVTGALKTILKTKEAADAALKLAAQTADTIGASRPEVAAQFADLLTKGFDLKKVDEIVKRLADLGTVDVNADLGRLTQLIGKIAALGKINQDVITDLSLAGLEAQDVFKALAQATGKTISEVQKDLSAGKIDAKTGVDAVLTAIKNQTGGLEAGVAANRKAFGTLGGLLKQISNIGENVLFDLDVGPSIEKIQGFLKGITDLFSSTSDTGKEVRAVLGEVFTAIVDGFLGTDVANGGDVFAETLKAVLKGVREAVPEIKSFAQQLRQIVDSVAAVTSAFAKVGGFELLVGIVEGFGAIVGLPVIAAAQVSAFVEIVFSALASVLDFIGGLASTIFDAALELGSSIIDGIVSGITGGAGAVIASITGVAGDAIASAKAVLGIASPSKEFQKIGSFTVQGFEQGIASNDGPSAAMTEMVAPPDLSAITAGGQALGASGRGGLSVNVHVDARGATAGDAKSIADMVAEEVARTVETLAVSFGAEAA